jgi:hypothetical protein
MNVTEPWVGQMAETVMGATLAVLSRPETAERIAAFARNYYDALVAKGFSADEALRIVLAHGVPFQPAGR